MPSASAPAYKPSATYGAGVPSSSPVVPYKGAASSLNAAGLLAGVGAIVALFI